MPLSWENPHDDRHPAHRAPSHRSARRCADEAIETGDTLLVHAEGVVAVAMTWPFAVTTAHGHLHSMAPLKDGDTLEIVAGSLKVEPGAIRRAAELARQLGFEIDPTVAPLLA